MTFWGQVFVATVGFILEAALIYAIGYWDGRTAERKIREDGDREGF